jgi:hypothetical protein
MAMRPADIDGERWFRSVAANPLADADHVVAAVLRTARDGQLP